VKKPGKEGGGGNGKKGDAGIGAHSARGKGKKREDTARKRSGNPHFGGETKKTALGG